MPSFDGLPPLPDLHDVDEIEHQLIPALEAWVKAAGRDESWAIRLTLLTTIHNRLFALRRFEALEAELAELRLLITEQHEAMTTAILDATDDGVQRVTAAAGDGNGCS